MEQERFDAKEVMIAIRGMHVYLAEDEKDEIETIYRGTFRREGDYIYLEYEEVYEDTPEVTHASLRIGGDELLLSRNGYINVDMDFFVGKKSLSIYKVPFGDILMGLNTTRIVMEESSDSIVVRVDYSVEINYIFMEETSLRVEVRPAG